MTVSLKHTFQSAKDDSLDVTVIQPSNWNEEHELELATNKLLGRATAGTGAAEEIGIGTALSISGGTLAVTNVPVANGGTGAATLTGYVKGNGTSAFTAAASVPVGDISGTLPVASGGTGATTLTANAVLVGNGTSAVTAVAPGTTGNLLTSNGTTWASTAPPAGGFSNVVVFTASGSWTIPAGITKAKVTVTGGGGGVTGASNGSSSGAAAGTAIKVVSLSGASATITIGAGGASGSSGGNSTFVNSATTVTGDGGGGSAVSTLGGSASGGDINVIGGDAGGTEVTNFGGRMGGASFWGGGGRGIASSQGANGRAYGSGAGACGASFTASGAGGVIVIEY